MLCLYTSGDACARGRQQGEACRELALGWMEPALAQLAGGGPVADAVRRCDARVSRWRRQMAAVSPESDAQCAGIAAGLGLDEPTYFTAYFFVRMAGVFGQCSTLGFRDAEGRPLLAKTDDLFADGLGRNVCEVTRPERGYAHIALHYAGTDFTVAGMNECGLCIGMTGIPGPSRDADGLVSLTALGTILPRCATVAEAIGHVCALRLNFYGFSLLLGDADGGLALLEKTLVDTVVLPPRADGAFAHTNHILDPAFAAKNPPQKPPIDANGRRRYATIERLLPSLPRSEEGMTTFLTDRSPSGGISQMGCDGLTTDFGVLFAPRENRMTLWPGPPAVTTPERWEAAEVF